MVGCEALVRWAHPVRGRLLPAEFIDLAEDTGLIVPLGARSCAPRAPRRQVAAPVPAEISTVNVNVSTRQLRDPPFPESSRPPPGDALDAGLLVLEITESLLPDDSDRIINPAA